MSLSIADRQAKIQALNSINNTSKALVANSLVISENLGKLFEAGQSRNPQQLSIIDSLVDFNVRAGFLTPKQQTIAAQIILQNADFFQKSKKSEADDSNTDNASTDFPE